MMTIMMIVMVREMVIEHDYNLFCLGQRHVCSLYLLRRNRVGNWWSREQEQVKSITTTIPVPPTKKISKNHLYPSLNVNVEIKREKKRAEFKFCEVLWLALMARDFIEKMECLTFHKLLVKFNVQYFLLQLKTVLF